MKTFSKSSGNLIATFFYKFQRRSRFYGFKSDEARFLFQKNFFMVLTHCIRFKCEKITNIVFFDNSFNFNIVGKTSVN